MQTAKALDQQLRLLFRIPIRDGKLEQKFQNLLILTESVQTAVQKAPSHPLPVSLCLPVLLLSVRLAHRLIRPAISL